MHAPGSFRRGTPDETQMLHPVFEAATLLGSSSTGSTVGTKCLCFRTTQLRLVKSTHRRQHPPLLWEPWSGQHTTPSAPKRHRKCLLSPFHRGHLSPLHKEGRGSFLARPARTQLGFNSDAILFRHRGQTCKGQSRRRRQRQDGPWQVGVSHRIDELGDPECDHCHVAQQRSVRRGWHPEKNEGRIKHLHRSLH